jgi:hypothetical protein
VRFAFNAYWFVALGCAAIVLFIIIQYFSTLISFVWGIYKRRASGKRAIERLRNLKHEEPPEPKPAVSPDSPLPVSAAVQPILDDAELPEPKPAVNPDLALQASAEAPILEPAEPPETDPGVSLELPLQASAEVQPILEPEERPEPGPAVSPDSPPQASAVVQPFLEPEEPPEPGPAVSPDLPPQASAEVQPILQHEEREPEPAVSPDLPPQASAEVQPILKHEEPEPEPAASPDLPDQAGAEVRKIPEHEEPLEPQPAVTPDLPLRVVAEVQAILEHEKPAGPEPVVSRNVYTAQKDYDLPTAEYNEAITLEPKFAATYENRTLTKSKIGRGSIGVTIRRLTDGAAHTLNVKHGALVVDIDENGTAKAAGIVPYDVIIKVDGKDVNECRDLPRIVADTPPGKEVVMMIIRNGKELTKTVRVGRLEDADQQAVAVDLMSEAAAKHLGPGMVIVQQQQGSSGPSHFLPTAPPRFGKRLIDQFSKVSR